MFLLNYFFLVSLNPLEQFEVFSLILQSGNGTFFIFIFFLFIFYFYFFFFWSNLFFSNIHFYFIYRGLIDFVRSVLLNNLNLKVYGFFPIVFFIFIFILFSNVLGIVPLFFTATSLASLTFFLSILFFIGINLIGIELHIYDFICLFVPAGVPGALLPLLISIELISYLVRPVSLAMRLCANMLAGHVLIKIISSYIMKVLESCFIFWFLIPIIFSLLLAITFLEFVIAFLQAYVFLVLICIYLNDIISFH